MTVSRRLRFEILRRDGYTCRYCGAKAPDATLTVDHVIPVALGGGDEPSNLVTACQLCNAGKASTRPDDPIVEDVDAAALLWAHALERASAKRRAEIEGVAAVQRWFHDWWDEMFSDSTLPPDWTTSIERFLGEGLSPEDLQRFAWTPVERSVTARNAFRYFCGACWREITTRHELARTMIEDGAV